MTHVMVRDWINVCKVHVLMCIHVWLCIQDMYVCTYFLIFLLFPASEVAQSTCQAGPPIIVITWYKLQLSYTVYRWSLPYIWQIIKSFSEPCQYLAKHLRSSRHCNIVSLHFLRVYCNEKQWLEWNIHVAHILLWYKRVQLEHGDTINTTTCTCM